MPWTFDDDTATRLVGTTADIDLIVHDADTAARLGSGDLAVLATPRVVGLVEQAACAALSADLPAYATTVGTRVDLRHRAASAVGAHVRATARITQIEGTRVQFEVTAVEDPDGRALLIADGSHTRVVVHRDDFLAALDARG